MKSGKYRRPTHIKTKCQRPIFDGNFAILFIEWNSLFFNSALNVLITCIQK